MPISFPIHLSPDDNGTVLATAPDLPELTTFGATDRDALANAEDALAEAIAARLKLFADIPRPGPGPNRAELDLQTALKLTLFWEMQAAQVSRAELARRMGQHRPQIERLFDSRHATRLDQYEAAFGALGLSLSVTPERRAV
jgi:antitoxin HicB